MRYGKFVDNKTIKTGPINRTIQNPEEIVIYKNSNSDNNRFANVDLCDYSSNISEGVVWMKNNTIIYKMSPKMITQLPFDRGYYLPEKKAEPLDRVWKGNLKYYIPEIYFVIYSNDSMTRAHSVYLVYNKHCFMPVLNLFTPYLLDALLTRNEINALSRIFDNSYNGIGDYVVSAVCTGSALANSNYSTTEEFLYHIGDICNTILSAPSNADLVPKEPDQSKWVSTYCESHNMGLDLILRLLSSISQKMSLEDYLKLLEKAHRDPCLIFARFLHLNDFTEDEERELIKMFLTTQHSRMYIRENEDKLIGELRSLKDREAENDR